MNTPLIASHRVWFVNGTAVGVEAVTESEAIMEALMIQIESFTGKPPVDAIMIDKVERLREE